MKRLSVFLISLLCIGGLIALWHANQPPLEVIKIYTAVPYEPEKTSTPAETGNVQPAFSDLSETEHETAAVVSEDDQIAEASTSSEEYSAFLEWLDALEVSELSTETLTEEPEEVVEPDTDTPAEIPYWQLSKMVRDAYDMESVLNEYGIFVDELGKDVCPKCLTYNFHIVRSLTGGPEEWCCMECEYPGGDVIEFVAWMKDIDAKEAARYLAERAGLLK